MSKWYLLVILLFVSTQSLQAQTGNAFEKLESQPVAREAKNSLSATNNEFSYMGNLLEDRSPNYLRWIDPNNPLEGVDGKNTSSASGPDAGSIETLKLDPGMRGHFFNMYGPMAGFSDTIMAPAYSKMVGNVVSSPLAVLNTTWHLTEPGVAEGVNNAIMQANDAVNLRYLAEQQLATQASFFSEWGNTMMKAYLSCVNKHLKDSTTDNAGWVKAVDKCLYDYDAASDDGTGSVGKAQNDFNEPEGSSFNFEHLIPVREGKDKDKVLLLTDLLFTEEAEQTPGVENDLEEIRDSFKKYIGDVEIKLEYQGGKASASASDGSSTPNPAGPALQLTFERIKPLDENGPEVAFEEKIAQAFNNIMGIMGEKCDWAKNNFAAEDLDPWDIKPFWHAEGDWTPDRAVYGGDIRNRIYNLSLAGFKFKPNLGDILYKLFTLKQHEAKDIDCLDIFGANGTTHAATTMYDQLKADPSKINYEHRVVYLLAKKIANGRMLGMYLRAAGTVDRMTQGVFNNYLHDYAMNVIYDSAGTKDIHGEYVDNLKQLETIVTKLEENEHSVSGNEGAGLAQPFKQEQSVGPQDHLNMGSNTGGSDD